MFTLIAVLLCLVTVLAVLLMQLGVTREVVVLQEKVTAFSQLLLRPPVPSFLKARLPKKAIEAIEAVGFRSGGPFILVFMKPACGGCFSLAEELMHATVTGALPRGAITCFLEEGSAGSKIDSLIRDTTRFVAETTSDGVFRACEVSATPTMLAINPETWEVFGHSVGGDAAWAVSRLEMARQSQLRLSPVRNP